MNTIRTLCAAIGMLFITASFTKPPMAVENASWGQIKEHFSDTQPAEKLVVTDKKVAATAERDRVKVSKNTAMQDASQYNPTAVLGAVHIKIGSVVVKLDKNDGFDYHLSNISIISNLPSGVLERVFSNVKLFTDGGQSGATGGGWGTMVDTVYFYDYYNVLKSTPMVFDVYADVNGHISAEDLSMINGAQDGIVRIGEIKATDYPSKRTVKSLGAVSTQKLYLAEHGEVRVRFSPDNPASPMFLNPGKEYRIRYELIASMHEDVMFLLFSPQLETSNGPGPSGRYIEEVRMEDPRSGESFGGGNIIVARNTVRSVDLSYRVSEDCPSGTELILVLDNQPQYLLPIGMTSARMLPLENIFNGQLSKTLKMVGVVVPVGCVDDTGFSLETGEFCGTYQK